jgi:hypothetical protein
MPAPPKFTGSIWFATVVALLVSLGAQVLFDYLVPIAALEWLYDKPPAENLVLIAGETSFWRVDTLFRVASFGLGAFIACLLARSHSWSLRGSLVASAVLATAFAQFPRPAAPWQLAIWSLAAPVGALLVIVLFRVRRADA